MKYGTSGQEIINGKSESGKLVKFYRVLLQKASTRTWTAVAAGIVTRYLFVLFKFIYIYLFISGKKGCCVCKRRDKLNQAIVCVFYRNIIKVTTEINSKNEINK